MSSRFVSFLGAWSESAEYSLVPLQGDPTTLVLPMVNYANANYIAIATPTPEVPPPQDGNNWEIIGIQSGGGALGQYKGIYNANTNTPTLANGVGVSGDWYYTTVAGNEFIEAEVGDVIAYNGSDWENLGALLGSSTDDVIVADDYVLVPDTIVEIGQTVTTALGALQSQINANQPMTTLGDVIGGGVAGVPTRVLGNTTTTARYLKSVGNGTISALPSFAQIAYTDISGTPTLGTVAQYNVGILVNNIPQLQSGGQMPAVGGANLVVTNPYTGLSDNLNDALEAAYAHGSTEIAQNIAGGSAGQILYQSAANTTAKLVNGTGALVNDGNGGLSYTNAPTLLGTNFSSIPNSATTAASANTANSIVARNASGNFSAGTITANLTGIASFATSLSGGNANTLVYQSSTSTTAFLTPTAGVLIYNGSALAYSAILGATYGGTGNGFTQFSGATTSTKTYTLPNASCNVLTDNAAVTVAQGGTGITTTTAYGLLTGGTTATGAFQNAGTGTAGQIYRSGGATALGTWSTLTAGSGISISNVAGTITISSDAEAAGLAPYNPSLAYEIGNFIAGDDTNNFAGSLFTPTANTGSGAYDPADWVCLIGATTSDPSTVNLFVGTLTIPTTMTGDGLNTFIGWNAGSMPSLTGTGNYGSGVGALHSSAGLSGSYNLALGNFAMGSGAVTSANYCSVIGYKAGYAITSGYGQQIWGGYTGSAGSTDDNKFIIYHPDDTLNSGNGQAIIVIPDTDAPQAQNLFLATPDDGTGNFSPRAISNSDLVDALNLQSNASWTPTDGSGASLSLTINDATVSRINNLIWYSINITYPSTGNGSDAIIASLPFASAAVAIDSGRIDGGAHIIAQIDASTSTIQLFNATTGAAYTNANLSTATILISGMYSI